MHNDDRELLIRLALLQADVQVYSNVLLGFVAVAFSVIFGFEEVYLGSRNDLFLLPIFLMPAVILFVVIFLVNKIENKKKEIKSLKKEYVW